MRRGADGGDAAFDVPSTLCEPQRSLARKSLRPQKEIHRRESPVTTESQRKPPGRDVAALPRTLRVAGHVHDRVDVRPRYELHDEGRSLLRQTPSAPVLPLTDERTRTFFVDDRRSCARKRQTAPRAFTAAPDGPRARRTAALADRTADSNQRSSADVAQRWARRCADGAALGQQKLEHTSSVCDYSLRLCEKMRSASWRVSAEPMSYHLPGRRHV
jgi:hypothetical protein